MEYNSCLVAAQTDQPQAFFMVITILFLMHISLDTIIAALKIKNEVLRSDIVC